MYKWQGDTWRVNMETSKITVVKINGCSRINEYYVFPFPSPKELNVIVGQMQYLESTYKVSKSLWVYMIVADRQIESQF